MPHNWGNRPRSSIPKRVRDQVMRRDKTCRLRYEGCTERIEEMDHVIGLAAQGIPRTPVLNADTVQGVCKSCHAIKSEQQRIAGIKRAQDTRGGLSRRLRDVEPHPLAAATNPQQTSTHTLNCNDTPTANPSPPRS
ncbi:hypothetical protein M2432_004910 [Mycobacterium sp. OTB74]|nr:hypothetical protein [Mycobacterium sp. OTB74]